MVNFLILATYSALLGLTAVLLLAAYLGVNIVYFTATTIRSLA